MDMTTERPSMIVHPHALVGDGRYAETAGFIENETLGEYIERLRIKLPNGPISVWHNGRRVPDKLWRRLIPKVGDQIVIRQRATGGGGDNKVLRTVAMIAIVVIAIVTQQYYAVSGTGLFGLSASATGSLLAAGVMIAGSLLVNALLPLPTASSAITAGNTTGASAYTLSGGQNTARQWQPMMLIMGKYKVAPDYGSNYFTVYNGNTQFLNQIFHFGLQADSITLSDFCIGTTPLSDYSGVQMALSNPADGSLTMFPGNVDTIAGATLTAGVLYSRTTSVNTNHISIEFAASLYYLNDDGSMSARSADLRIQYRKTGTTTWADISTMQDAIYATHYWSLQVQQPVINGDPGNTVGYYWMQVSYGSTNYADHTEGDTEVVSPGYHVGGDADYDVPAVIGTWKWVVHPYQLGQPWDGVAPDPLIGYSTDPGLRMTGNSQDVVRQTLSWDVPLGQYDIQIWKVTGDIVSSREANQVAVNQVLCYQPDTGDYTGQLRVALRIQATSQLNGAVSQFNAMAQQSCPVWNGTAWVFQPTSNPAWIFLWYARGKVDASGNRLYGGNLPDSRIDLDSIKAWGAFCDEKNLEFNYVLTDNKTVHDVLTMIARAGRASYTWQTGKIGVVWNAAGMPIVAMVGPFNIKSGTFTIDYSNTSTADKIVLNFINPDNNWQQDAVHVDVPNVSQTNNTATLTLDGCTSADQAGREANLIAADQEFHRRQVSWEMDIEGMIATRGDVIQMTHDLTVWSYSSRWLSFDGVSILMDNSIPPVSSGWVSLRAPDNTMLTVQASVTQDANGVSTLHLNSDLPDTFPVPGMAGFEENNVMDWALQFDPLATPGRRIKIINCQPGSNGGIKFTGIDDTQEYYDCENNLYGYTPPRDGALLSGLVLSLTATEQIVSVSADQIRVTFAWVLSMEMSSLVTITVNGNVRFSQVLQGRTQDIVVRTGDVLKITVVPQRTANTNTGTATSLTYNVLGLTEPLPAITGLNTVFRDDLTTLVWDAVTDVRNPSFEVRIGDSWTNARTVAITTTNSLLAIGNGQYWIATRFALNNGTVVYGTASSITISGAVLVRNVVIQQDEAPVWHGTCVDGAYLNDGQLTLAPNGDILSVADVLALYPDSLFTGGCAAIGSYQIAIGDRVDIGFTTSVRVTFNFNVLAFNLNSDIFTPADLLALADVLGGSDLQNITVTPQVRVAGDDGVYGDWMNYTPGLISARYFDIRIILATADTMVIPFVTDFTWTVDVPDLVEHDEGITINEAGVRVTYPQDFHIIPNVQVTILEAQPGDQAVVTSSDETGFNVQIVDSTGTGVSRSINWLAQGY